MIKDIVGIGVSTACMLLTEHVVLYERLDRTDAYAVGVGTIGGGLAAYAIRQPEAKASEMVAAFVGIALISGAAVKAAYLVRRQIETRDRLAAAAGLTAGIGLRGGGKDGTDSIQPERRDAGDNRVGAGQRGT